MIAFLKRRWILLSCALVLLACSVVDEHRTRNTITRGHLINSRVVSKIHRTRSGLLSGEFVYQRYADSQLLFVRSSEPSHLSGFHLPTFGSMPEVIPGDSHHLVIVPIWLPLSAILGWIVIRELRWREKRAKENHLPGA